jgi:hypothetical protein
MTKPKRRNYKKELEESQAQSMKLATDLVEFAIEFDKLSRHVTVTKRGIETFILMDHMSKQVIEKFVAKEDAEDEAV